MPSVAQLSSHIAWENHPGRFAGPRLEAVGMEAGRRGLPAVAARAPEPGRRERVLHVLTTA